MAVGTQAKNIRFFIARGSVGSQLRIGGASRFSAGKGQRCVRRAISVGMAMERAPFLPTLRTAKK